MPFPLRADIESIEKQIWKWPYALLIAAWVKFPILTFSIIQVKYLIDNNWDFANKYEMSGRFGDLYTLHSSWTLLTLASSPHSHALIKSSLSSLRMSSELCWCFSQFPSDHFLLFLCVPVFDVLFLTRVCIPLFQRITLRLLEATLESAGKWI